MGGQRGGEVEEVKMKKRRGGKKRHEGRRLRKTGWNG